ncbi:unnamed protein product, partial [Heterosigma akashiwo]
HGAPRAGAAAQGPAAGAAGEPGHHRGDGAGDAADQPEAVPGERDLPGPGHAGGGPARAGGAHRGDHRGRPRPGQGRPGAGQEGARGAARVRGLLRANSPPARGVRGLAREGGSGRRRRALARQG